MTDGLTVPAVADRFLAALSARDFDALSACFTPDVRFRALTPNSERAHQGDQTVAEVYRGWFRDCAVWTPTGSAADMLADRLHLSYTYSVDGNDGPHVVQQHAYCQVSGDRIADIAIICSGFRAATH